MLVVAAAGTYIDPPRTVAQVQKGRSVATSDACVSAGGAGPIVQYLESRAGHHGIATGDGAGVLAMDVGRLGGKALRPLCLVE